MKAIQFSTALLFFFFLLSVVSSQPPELPNIGYVALGYNVFKGNPHSTTQFDPGFGGAAIFNLTYYQHQTTSDGRWSIPDNVNVPGTATVCNVEGTSTTIYFASSYQSSLSVDASFSISGFGASFTASADYKTVCKQTEESNSVFVSTQASCETYLVNINAFVHPVLSDAFYNNAINLPTTFDPNNATLFWQFLDIVGTHFTNQMVFGSRWGYSFQSSETQWTTMQSQDLDVDVAASYAGMINAGVNVATNSCAQMAKNFTENTQCTAEFSLGNPPPSNGNTNDWLQSSLTSTLMDPLQYQLVNISCLFTSDYTNDPQLTDRFTAMTQALENYCPMHLLPQQIVVSCALPPAPPPPPPPIGAGAIMCEVGNDCKDLNAGIFCGTSPIEAQEVLLDFCPVGESCDIQVSIPYEGNASVNCMALAVDYSNGGWVIVVGCEGPPCGDAAVSLCEQYSGSTCLLTTCGCAYEPDSSAMWGAIACSENCDAYASTANGQGYPSRMEAHSIAKESLSSGPNSGFIMIDFDQCGAVAKNGNGMAAAGGPTPQCAETAALNACNNAFGGGCNLLVYSCSVTSLSNRGRTPNVRLSPIKKMETTSNETLTLSRPVTYSGSKKNARAFLYSEGHMTYLTESEMLNYY